MNPIKVFLSMFAAGILLTIILGFIGLSQDPQEAAGGGDGTTGDQVAVASPEAIVQQSCLGCHGGDLKGGMGGAAPSLVNMQISKEEIIDVLLNGQGTMPGGLAKGHEEVVAEYLLSIQE